MPQLDRLSAQLDRLANWDPGPFPVTSLYLNLQPNPQGRDHFEPFLRKELAERVATYPAHGPERRSIQKDVEKIEACVNEVDRSANGLAVFACSGADLFEALPLAAPIEGHRLFVASQPHLYPLARLIDEYPRYAVLVADTNTARIFVFAANELEHAAHVQGPKVKHHKAGGWSQARYQRHTENFHLHHAKEVVDTLGRIVRKDAIRSIVIAGDEVIVPLLKDQLPKELAERVVDVLKLNVHTPDRDVLEATIATMRELDAKTDREKVEALLDAYRANGLACIGLDQTRKALERGQVDELLIGASSDEHEGNELVIKARQTSANIRFIEDAALLAPAKGVGAFLRFKL